MASSQFFTIFQKNLPYFIGFLLFIYVVIRAIILPITHDESNTCLVYSTMSVYDIITYKIPIPNNHIFNTLLIKLSTWLFGWSNLSVRLPNVLGFIMYYYSVLSLLKRMNNDVLFILFGLVLMTFNPFLLDFFSMARGYALATSFMMASILFSVYYLERRTVQNLAIATVFAAISVYTSFTLLNFYAAFVGLLGLVLLIELRTKRFTEVFMKLSILIVVSVFLGILSYLPVKKMIATEQFRFWKAGGFYSGTVKTLLISSFYTEGHFKIPISVITIPVGILFFIFSFYVLKSIWRDRTITQYYQLFFLLFSGTVLVNILHFYIAGTPYLSGRTALFYIPLFGITMIGFVSQIEKQKVESLPKVMTLLSIMGMLHLFRTINLTHCYEWSYDADTYKVLAFLKKEHELNPDKTITLSTNWRFYPSFKFYIETEKLHWLKIEDFHNTIKLNSSYQYYYTVSDEAKELEFQYSKILSLGFNSRALMKKK